MSAKRRGRMAAGGLFLLLLGGCVTLDLNKSADPPAGPVQMAVVWRPSVLSGSDPMREGADVHALTGALYLFDKSGLPIAAPGKVEVRLYPDPPNPAAPETPLEIWRIDADTLKSKLQRDYVGLWSYGLVLPWSTYRPDLTHIRLTTRFEPVKGPVPVMFASDPHLTLHGDGPPEVVATTSIPALHKQ